MSRVNLIKQFIRLGMKIVPNKLPTYRLLSKGGQWLVRAPKNFQVDAMKVNNVPVVWLNAYGFNEEIYG